MKMLEFNNSPQHVLSERLRTRRSTSAGPSGSRPLEARVKPECVTLYPGVDPKRWHPVVQEGEYKDDMEGLWIQVVERVTYVLARHFDLQARPEAH
jgi:hypothetical protein